MMIFCHIIAVLALHYITPLAFIIVIITPYTLIITMPLLDTYTILPLFIICYFRAAPCHIHIIIAITITPFSLPLLHEDTMPQLPLLAITYYYICYTHYCHYISLHTLFITTLNNIA